VQKWDAAADGIAKVAYVATSTLLQTRPDCLLAHRFSPHLDGAIYWIEKHPQALNALLNLSVQLCHVRDGEASRDLMASFSQLAVNHKCPTKLNRLLSLIAAIRICQICVQQPFAAVETISCLSYLQNICYNSFVINLRT
jgi:hypothetical protein